MIRFEQSDEYALSFSFYLSRNQRFWFTNHFYQLSDRLTQISLHSSTIRERTVSINLVSRQSQRYGQRKICFACPSPSFPFFLKNKYWTLVLCFFVIPIFIKLIFIPLVSSFLFNSDLCFRNKLREKYFLQKKKIGKRYIIYYLIGCYQVFGNMKNWLCIFQFISFQKWGFGNMEEETLFSYLIHNRIYNTIKNNPKFSILISKLLNLI